MPLRRLIEEDLPMVLKWRNAPEVRHSMFSSHVISEDEHWAWYRRVVSDSQSLWCVYVDSLSVPGGVVGFTKMSPHKKSAFWGFYVGTEAQPGTGTAVGVDALNFAFDALELHKLNAEVLYSNEKSRKLHLKLGFSLEGCFRDSHFDGSGYVDVLRFGLLEHEWSNCKASCGI